MALATGDDSAPAIPVPDGARAGLEVRWFSDLVAGTGAARALEPRLREALAVATADGAVEAGTRIITVREAAQATERERVERAERGRREAAEEAERERRVRREADMADQRRDEADQLWRAKSRYWVILGLATGLCVTVVIPLLVGITTRDSAFRPRDERIYDTSFRKDGAYFLTDWLTGSAWIALAAGLVLTAVAVSDWHRRRLSPLRIVLSLGVVTLCPLLASQAAVQWERAELTLALGPVPADWMPCPGLPADGVTADVSDGDTAIGQDETSFTADGISWRAATRVLGEADEAGALELGVCFYAGLDYAGTVSLGRVPSPVGEPWPLHLLVDGSHGIVAIETGSADSDDAMLYGAPFDAVVDEAQWGPLTPVGLADRLPPPAGSTQAVTRDVAWSVAVPQRSQLRVEYAAGPRLVFGPGNSGFVGDLVAIDRTGVAVVVAPAVSDEGWSVVLRIIYLVRGASPTSTGTALIELGPDLAVVWESDCPDRGPVYKDGDGAGFVCGNFGDHRADLTARQWVGSS